MSIANNLFQDLTIDRQMLNQRSTPEGAKVKRVQHDTMMKDGGALTHVPHGHPELVSGSEDSNNQMLKRVQHDEMIEEEGKKTCHPRVPRRP